jgi:hypothetical protein
MGGYDKPGMMHENQTTYKELLNKDNATYRKGIYWKHRLPG